MSQDIQICELCGVRETMTTAIVNNTLWNVCQICSKIVDLYKTPWFDYDSTINLE